MSFLAENEHFSSIPFLIGRVFSIFGREMERRNPSEPDIKLLIPAPLFFFKCNYFPLLQHGIVIGVEVTSPN